MVGWIVLGLTMINSLSSQVATTNPRTECKSLVTDFNPNFHIQLPANTLPALNIQSLYLGNFLHVIYENGLLENPYTHLATSNFNDFINITTDVLLPPNSKLLFVIYDDDNSANFTNNNISQLIAAYQVQSNNMQNLVYANNWKNGWKEQCKNTSCFNMSLSNAVSVNWNDDLGRWIGEDVNYNMYSSPNLQNWTLFKTQSVSYSETHEELFPLSLTENPNVVKWVLIVGSRPSYRITPSYYLGNIRPQGYIKEYTSGYALDYVPDSKSYSIAHEGNAVKDSKILVGSISMKSYLTPPSIPTEWSDILLTPRNVTLKQFADRYYVIQTPLGDFESRVKAAHFYSDLEITPNCNPISCFRTLSFRIAAEIHLNSASRVGFIVRKSSSQGTEIAYDKSSGFYVDRRNSGFPVSANLDSTCYYSQKYSSNSIVKNGIVKFIIIVDVSLVEVFCDDGKVVFSFLIFSNRQSDSVELFSISGTAIAKRIDVQIFDG